MNYYEHHLGDYVRDTAHLSMLEDGAYRRLIDVYYLRQGPLPAAEKEIFRLARAFGKPEREAVGTVLREYFKLDADGWHNPRCDKELARFRLKQEKAAASANARWHPSERNADAMRTHSEGNALQSPVTSNQTPEKKVERAKRATARGTRLPTDWGLTEERIAIAKAEGLNAIRTHEAFRDYWLAKAGAGATKVDWDATWRSWCRKQSDWQGARPGVSSPANDPAATAWAELIASDGAKRDAKVHAAIDAVGGWLAIKGRNSFTEAKLRAEFCDAYRRAA